MAGRAEHAVLGLTVGGLGEGGCGRAGSCSCTHGRRSAKVPLWRWVQTSRWVAVAVCLKGSGGRPPRVVRCSVCNCCLYLSSCSSSIRSVSCCCWTFSASRRSGSTSRALWRSVSSASLAASAASSVLRSSRLFLTRRLAKCRRDALWISRTAWWTTVQKAQPGFFAATNISAARRIRGETARPRRLLTYGFHTAETAVSVLSRSSSSAADMALAAGAGAGGG